MLTSFLQHDHRYRSQCVYHSERSGSKIKRETYLDPAPRGATDRDGEEIDIHGKLKVKIQFGTYYLPTCCVCRRYCRPFHSWTGLSKGAWFHSRLQQEQLRSIHEEVTIFKLNTGQNLFDRNSSDIGHTTVTQHRIDTADHPPIKQHPRRLPFVKQEEVGTLLREMQENDIIEPSSSPWASPIILVRGRTFEEHLQNIRKVLSKLSDANLKLNPSKCKFFQKEVNYLGHHLCRRCSYGPRKSVRRKGGNALKTSEIDGQERVVAYWVSVYRNRKEIIVSLEKELLAIVKAIEHFHPHYLYGQKFLLRTDHASLTWLMNFTFRNTEGQVARWIQRLNRYYFDISHRKGSSLAWKCGCPFKEDHAQKNCRHCSRVETKYDYAIRQITSTATLPDPWVTRKFEKTRWRILILNPL
ncbi:retrovirus-related Pol polyprotein from transposon 412 [Trichonephila clavipes]|nr:retrovirus-related Pol polyprotein from transposon 412 [Trichonephila clavipes]